jgi:NAD(P)-dependent dehydrogenase (short-subunit alcohol dehydrogenase family)
MSDRPDSSNPDLTGRIALVTGATRGIGRAVALALAASGAQVVATGRTSGALEELDDAIKAVSGRRATLLTLNLKHGDKIDGLGPALHGRFGKLDILVASAGILGPLSPLGHIPTDQFQEVIDINLTANWRLIRTLDPLLKLSDAGRAVFLTSGAALAKLAYWGPYAVSKAGLEALVKTYAMEVANTTVRANLVSPGPIRTRMREKAFPGEDPMTLKTPEELAPTILQRCAAAFTENGTIFEFKTGTVRQG